METYRKELLDL